MSKKKIELLVSNLIMPLPWVNELPPKFVFDQPVKPTSKNNVSESVKPVNVIKKDIVSKKEQIQNKDVVKVSIGKLKGRLKSSSGISIKKTIEKKEQEALNSQESTAKTHFNFEQLDNYWQLFANIMKEEGKKSFHTSLTKRKPVLKENYVVEMVVDNKVQEENLIKEKPILLDYLKSKLDNYSLTINTIVVEQKNEVHLYTDKEKFKEILKTNPDLMYLKERLGLDFEF